MKALELVGQKFGRLAVESKNPVRSMSGHIRWDCLCDCGNKTTVTGDKLTNGNTKSCGCLEKENISKIGKLRATHGMTNTSEYGIWVSIIQRCTNKNDRSYSDYGGRGITVCDRWLNSFEAFYEDMGPRPSPNHSIDREENNGDYEKNNCRWATYIEQNNNTRVNVFHTHNGVTRTIAEWSRVHGIERNKLYYRLIIAKWDFERAVRN